jgi:hypothetical protein
MRKRPGVIVVLLAIGAMAVIVAGLVVTRPEDVAAKVKPGMTADEVSEMLGAAQPWPDEASLVTYRGVVLNSTAAV